MYTVTRNVSARRLLVSQVPSLGGAFLIAESFYKFHSFTLECLAFLATWYVLDFLVDRVIGAWQSERIEAESTGDA